MPQFTMNKIGSFFKKLFTRKTEAFKAKEQKFTMQAKLAKEDADAVKEDRITSSFAGHWASMKNWIMSQVKMKHEQERGEWVAHPAHPVRNWKPLPRFIEVGINRRRSIEYRHHFRVPCSKHPKDWFITN